MKEYIVLGGGCFWGLEKLLAEQEGVLSTSVGYAGGELKNPGYSDVKHGDTGHVESVKIEYDSSVLSAESLFRFFFKIHDPTSENRQGNDVGTQYRSVVFYNTDEQKNAAALVIKEVDESGKWSAPIVTKIEKERDYHLAEDYHQKYLDKNPNGYTCHFIRD